MRDAHSAEKCQLVLQPFLRQVIGVSCFEHLRGKQRTSHSKTHQVFKKSSEMNLSILKLLANKVWGKIIKIQKYKKIKVEK